MRYFLPPPDDPFPRTVGGAARIHASGRLDAHPDPEAPDLADGRLVRLSQVPAAEAAAHLAGWEAEAPAHDIPAPAHVIARERSRADRVHPGRLRRQRLAMTLGSDPATVAHWSVPEPPLEADERAWQRLLARLTGATATAAPPAAGDPPPAEDDGSRHHWSA